MDKITKFTMLIAWLALVAGTATAQNYPTKPVRLVVPYAPAGVADILGRVVAEKLGQRLGQTVVVFNREGGGSAVGADLVTELFKHQAKIDLTHVPYKGVAPALIELAGGQIELVMSGITNAVPLVRSGKLIDSDLRRWNTVVNAAGLRAE